MIKHLEINKAILDTAGTHQQDYIMQCMREHGLPIVMYPVDYQDAYYATDVEVRITWLSNGNLRFSWEAEEKSLDSLA